MRAGADLSFEIGTLSVGEQISFAYAVLIEQPPVTDMIFTSPLMITWVDGSLVSYNQATIQGNSALPESQVYLVPITTEQR